MKPPRPSPCLLHPGALQRLYPPVHHARWPHGRRAAAIALLAAAATSGCATLGPAAVDPGTAPTAAALAPPAWRTAPAPRPATAPSLPHEGRVTDLTRWWSQFDDPLLARLIDRAQGVSPSVSAAAARIAQARATLTGAGAALGPTLDATTTAVRGRPDALTPAVGSSISAALQAGWELDLFGGARAGRDAAAARLEGSVAGWHDARVSVAADTAVAYLQLRACEAQRAQSAVDAASRAETARLTGLAENAGFQSPSAAALARASAAQGRATLAVLRAQCDSLVHALVALTGWDEPDLRTALAPATGRLPQLPDAAIALPALPADVLRQRPDLRAAEAEWLAASADRLQADAARWPRVRLTGTLGATRLVGGDASAGVTTWSLGPVSVSLPLLDGGARAAQSDAAGARLADAERQLQARVRSAVREVEDALVQLRATAERSEDVAQATRDFERSFRAAEARQRGGLASLFELEDARRTAVAAASALIDLQRERTAAWIALYRAVGGGWTPAAAPVSDRRESPPPPATGPTPAPAPAAR
jgi:multidrug efflux system outer membrane protein